MNINPESSYSDTKDFNFGIIKMNTAGIQLDPTHHADNSTVTLFTQVISAACSRGFTADKADSLYRALASLSKLELRIYIILMKNMLKLEIELHLKIV